MAIVYATSSVPGSLYCNGNPVGITGSTPLRMDIPQGGAHVLFAAHGKAYLPISRFLPPGKNVDTSAYTDLRTIIWPSGSVEIHFAPYQSALPHTLAVAPFMQGTATLMDSSGHITLDVRGRLFEVGTGNSGGLRLLDNGLLAAFSADAQQESLLLVKPGTSSADVSLKVQGRQVLLSPEGSKIRVNETLLPGSLHSITRDYRFDGHNYVTESSQVTRTGDTADTPAKLTRAFTAAVLLGALDDAHSMLTPSLAGVVTPRQLKEFFGEFDGYTTARHTPTMAGVEMLALLIPSSDVHMARIMAFEVISAETGLAIENIRAWDSGDGHM